MASASNATPNDVHARKHMAELEKNYRLQHAEIEMLRAELALLEERNQVVSNLNSNLEEREGGFVRAVAEKEQRLSEALELVDSLKVENKKLMATMQQMKMKFHQLYEENRKIPELSAEVDWLHQELSQGMVLKEARMTWLHRVATFVRKNRQAQVGAIFLACRAFLLCF